MRPIDKNHPLANLGAIRYIKKLKCQIDSLLGIVRYSRLNEDSHCRKPIPGHNDHDPMNSMDINAG